MTDQPALSLADQALSRLRRLANGNGLTPDAIAVLESDEKTYTLHGVMDLVPFCEVGGGRYAGPVQGKNRMTMADHAALQMEAKQRQQSFMQGKEWIGFATAKLREQPGEGWGLDSVRIDIPHQTVTLAATGACPQCRGQRQIMCQQCNGQRNLQCPQCQGRKLEVCYNCQGRGEDPLQPGKPCHLCNGTRYAPCRQCHSLGTVPCPTCHGQGGIACPMCRGSGQMTEEISLTCGVTTSFKLKGEGMPSGFRRALDRLGIDNLAKGYGDISTVEAPVDTTPLVEGLGGAYPPPPSLEEPPHEEHAKEQTPNIYYEARVPYADLRMSFNGKKALVGAFGKRAGLIDVPAFLDMSLQPARDKLTEAAQGKATLEDAMDARAMRDALALTITGKEKITDLRKIYPLGLSNDAMKEILINMRRALNRFTLRMRGIVAVIYGLLCAAVLGGIFLTPTHASLTQNWPPNIILAVDLILPVILILGGWLMLSASTHFLLKRKFTSFKIPMLQKTGKIGLGMMGFIALVYMGFLAFAPMKPAWVLTLMHVLHH